MEDRISKNCISNRNWFNGGPLYVQIVKAELVEELSAIIKISVCEKLN